MTNALLAQGATISWAGEAIMEVTNFDLGQDVDDLEVTSHDSPNSTREYIAGLVTPSEIAMSVNWDWALHNELFAAQGNSALTDDLLFGLTDGSNLSVQAYVKGIVIHVPATGAALTADITFRTTGALTGGS